MTKKPSEIHCCFGDETICEAFKIPGIENAISIVLAIRQDELPELQVCFFGEEETKVYTLEDEFKYQLAEVIGPYISVTLEIRADALTVIEIEREVRVGEMEKIKNLLKSQTPVCSV